MIDIVIVGSQNNLTKSCIESIEQTTTNYNIIRVEWTGNYNHSLNKGIKLGTSEHVALCNNDLIFLEGWKGKALEALKTYDSVSPSEPTIHKELTEDEVGFKIAWNLCGWCIITTRSLLRKINYLDQRVKFWGSDYVYGGQLKKRGLKHAVIKDCKVIHLGSQTLNKLPKQLYDKITIPEARKSRRLYGKLE